MMAIATFQTETGIIVATIGTIDETITGTIDATDRMIVGTIEATVVMIVGNTGIIGAIPIKTAPATARIGISTQTGHVRLGR